MATSVAGKGIKVAIIGSGPSGFYCAARLLTQNAIDVKVHMYERLPTPHGLVRYGVAPDHPEVKNVENKFASIAMSPSFRFFGNVNIIGSSSTSDQTTSKASSSYSYPLATKLPFSSLLPHYTHIILSYGSSLSRPLGIPGSEAGALFNVHPALDFVNWYNGHPAAHDPDFLAEQPWKQVSLEGLQHATIVGAGNVALDVARILLRSSSTLNNLFQKDADIKARASLGETDIPEVVLSQLSKSNVKHVDVVARRGPAQVAFTNKELREMMELQGVSYQGVQIEDLYLARGQISALEAYSGDAGLGQIRVRKRLLSILEKGSKADKDSSVTWSTSFLQSPRQFKGKKLMTGNQVVNSVEWDQMAFKGIPVKDEQQEQPWSASSLASNSGNQLIKTGNVKSTSTDLVITSVGYQGAPLDGSDPIQTRTGLIPWDAKRGIIPNRTGRVLGDNAKAIPGLYVSGWLASGPVGVIASTRIDSNTVSDQLLQDWLHSPKESSLSTAPQSGIPTELQSTTQPVVSWSDWLRLDAEEIHRGKQAGKSREKILSVREMLNTIA